jgi:maleate cis-trans isomerase
MPARQGASSAGFGHDQAIAARLARVVEAPAKTTSTAVVRALHEMGVDRAAVVAP